MCPRIKIEDKHTYNTLPTRVIQTQVGRNTPMDNCITYNQIAYPIEGTGENERIGNKIMTSSIMSEGYITLRNKQPGDSGANVFSVFSQITRETAGAYMGRQASGSGAGIIQNLNNEFTGFYGEGLYNQNNEPFDVTVRHFLVEFDDNVYLNQYLGESTSQEIQDFLALWYEYLVINTCRDQRPSNSMQILRESTPYTGNFRILYDKTHHLTKFNHTLHYSYTIPYKRQINFDPNKVDYRLLPGVGTDIYTSTPSNKIVLEFFIGPTNMQIDFGNLAFGDHLVQYYPNELLPLANQYGTLKLKYTDI